MAICWLITVLATLASALLVVDAFGGQNGAPQQAALGALAAAISIIPYVFTRAIEGICRPTTEVRIKPADPAEEKLQAELKKVYGKEKA